MWHIRITGMTRNTHICNQCVTKFEPKKNEGRIDCQSFCQPCSCSCTRRHVEIVQVLETVGLHVTCRATALRGAVPPLYLERRSILGKLLVSCPPLTCPRSLVSSPLSRSDGLSITPLVQHSCFIMLRTNLQEQKLPATSFRIAFSRLLLFTSSLHLSYPHENCATQKHG